MKIEKFVKGKTVLDVGAWDGFFSFQAEKMGAKKVVAVDPFMWNGSRWGSKDGFNLAKQVLNSDVNDIDLENISQIETLGKFDLVLFLGVFYHLKDPLVVLEKISNVTKEMIILESEIDMRNNKFPLMSFNFDKSIFQGDSFWIPNEKAVYSLLKTVGFQEIKTVHQSDIMWMLGRSYLNRHKSKLSFTDRMKIKRAVFHAEK